MLSLTWLVAGRARGGRARLIGTAAGVAVGVALLLLILGAYNGLTDRTERSTWTYLSNGVSTTIAPGQNPIALNDGEVLAASTSAAGTAADLFDGHAITRVDIAATADSTVEVPGVGTPPSPGEYFASPALADLIAAHPADELEDRYGVQAGIISTDALASPDSLVVVVGAEQGQLAALPGVMRLSQFQGFAYPGENYRVAAIVGGIAVLFPIVVLIGIVTRLGQAARAERFAALRLMGATPHRVAAIAGIETGATSLLGAVIGVALFWLLIPVASLVSIEDGRFFASDLHVDAVTTTVIAVGTVLVATAVAYLTTRTAGIDPLGASRELRERRPRVIAVVPLLVGVVILGATAALSAAGLSIPRIDAILIGGFVIVAIGLLLAGPVLTEWVSRLGAAGARSAAAVLAMNRIRQHPRATFRAVSGLVLAVFIVSVFAAAITTARTEAVVEAGPDERIPATALVGYVNYGITKPSQEDIDAQTAPIAALGGVTDVIAAASHPEDGLILTATDAARLGLTVPDDTGFVRVDSRYFANMPVDSPVVVEPVADDIAAEAWPASIIVLTDGSTDSLERARTALVTSELPLWMPPNTRTEAAAGLQTFVSRYAGLANIGILIATLISAVSLAVSTIAGILDRRRVLGLLRLTGMPATTLRKMLVAEAAIPIATVFALCIGLGFLVAWTLLAGLTQGRRTVSWPDPDYYITIAISLALAAAAVIATFQTARQSTSIAATRFE